jgi:hypothetical protein
LSGLRRGERDWETEGERTSGSEARASITKNRVISEVERGLAASSDFRAGAGASSEVRTGWERSSGVGVHGEGEKEEESGESSAAEAVIARRDTEVVRAGAEAGGRDSKGASALGNENEEGGNKEASVEVGGAANARAEDAENDGGRAG